MGYIPKHAATMAEIKPDAEIDVFGWSDLYGRGCSAKQVWAYEEELSEIRREKERRMRKYMMKHEVRNDGKSIRKEKRKFYKKEKRYGSIDFYRGLMTVRKYRQMEAEKADALDFANEMYWAEYDAEIAEYEAMRKAYDALYELKEWLKWA